MKIIKIILIFAAALISFSSCAQKLPPRASYVVPIIAPKVEQVRTQAKTATTQADKTVDTIAQTKQKYFDYTDENIKIDLQKIEDAAKQTAVESKKTEFQLEFLQEYAKNVDIQAGELAKESEEKDEFIGKQILQIQESKAKIIEQKASATKKNAYLLVALLIILILSALILKPWRWV